ncbi:MULTISPECIES: hypothetical protein [Streptomyces]|nr:MULTISPECIES: hypothetical protein [Streptomyces]MDX3362174.1 hypothetical protein [Streptomyces sp. ME02-6978.2a]
MSQEPEYPPLRDMGGRNAETTAVPEDSLPARETGLEALRRENAELLRRTTELRNRLHAHPGITLA